MPASVCVITGASRGIGLATALRFARAGYHLVIAARRAQPLRQAAERIAAVGAAYTEVVADVGTREGAERLIESARSRCGRIDVLVNNAGAAPLAAIVDTTDEQFAAAVAANCAAIFYTTRAVWPLMRDQGSGTIINVSSMASVDPFRGFAVYGACKAWVNLFTRATADEGRALGIRAFAVAPGAVETDMLRSCFPELPKEQTLDPDDVAATIEALCDERFGYCSGQTVFLGK